ncbi:MAG TPA: DUF4266 domain-containing protein [Myxococcota bacterium]|nr:DUF4266 domain-containing protein [Myxococcota bacterium]
MRRVLATGFLVWALGVGAGAAAGVGCAPLRPWERGLLAHRCMDPRARPEARRARLHLLTAREASRGGEGESGGGCGCQ